MSKLVCGVGINDSETKVQQYESGKLVWICPFYLKWRSMLQRCYCQKLHEKHPSYIECSVCEEWLTFSNFREWMKSKNWQDKHLDKDLLIEGNKVYSPDTCIFVSGKVNNFTIDRAAKRGDYLIGVCWNKKSGKFKSQCKNPFTGKVEHLGLFKSELDAHKAWKKRKHEHALKLADEIEDQRLKLALQNRYK